MKTVMSATVSPSLSISVYLFKIVLPYLSPAYSLLSNTKNLYSQYSTSLVNTDSKNNLMVNLKFLQNFSYKNIAETVNKQNKKCLNNVQTLFILIPAGFEPATVRLEGECSIQLSYETTNPFILTKYLFLCQYIIHI